MAPSHPSEEMNMVMRQLIWSVIWCGCAANAMAQTAQAAQTAPTSSPPAGRSESPAQTFRLPFNSRWFVAQGGDTLNVNHHMTNAAQAHGLDFVMVAGASQREISTPNPQRVEDFFAWGRSVLAPHDGEVVAVVNDMPDNALGVKDADHPAGNHVGIQIAPDRFVFLGHLQRGSITVKPGDRVVAGQTLGRCGNSGNSDHPHVHMHVQDRRVLGSGHGQMPVFANINVELSGKVFEQVTWPLTRGLFVSNR
jgi:murein DD-endopeptidase MepM/ murein hydrolase activator NlpD